jgi:hypothetical protein
MLSRLRSTFSVLETGFSLSAVISRITLVRGIGPAWRPVLSVKGRFKTFLAQYIEMSTYKFAKIY